MGNKDDFSKGDRVAIAVGAGETSDRDANYTEIFARIGTIEAGPEEKGGKFYEVSVESTGKCYEIEEYYLIKEGK